MTFWSSTSYSDIPTDQVFLQFMTLIELVLSRNAREHLQQVWHARSEHLSFRNPNPKPLYVYMQPYGNPFVQNFQCFD